MKKFLTPILVMAYALGFLFLIGQISRARPNQTQAMAALLRGDYPQAIRFYEGLISRNPHDWLAWQQLAHLWQRLGRTSELNELLTRWRGVAALNPDASPGLVTLLVSLGQTTAAGQLASQACQDRPVFTVCLAAWRLNRQTPQIPHQARESIWPQLLASVREDWQWSEIAQVLNEMAWSDQLPGYRHIIPHIPPSRQRDIVAQWLEQVRQDQHWRQLKESLLRIAHPQPYDLWLLAEIYRREANSELAIPLLEQANHLAPAIELFGRDLAECYEAHGAFGEAQRLWEEIRNRRDSADAYRHLAEISSKIGQESAASHFLELALARGSQQRERDAIVRALLPRLLHHKNFVRLEHIFTESLTEHHGNRSWRASLVKIVMNETTDPTLAGELRHHLAGATAPALIFLRAELCAQNDPAAAIPLYEQLLKQDPHDPELLATLSHLYQAGQRAEEARLILERLINLNPHRTEPWRQLFECFQAGNQADRIEQRINQSTGGDLRPLCDASIQVGATVVGIRCYQRLLADRPEDVAGRFRLGSIYLQQLDYDRAAVEFWTILDTPRYAHGWNRPDLLVALLRACQGAQRLPECKARLRPFWAPSGVDRRNFLLDLIYAWQSQAAWPESLDLIAEFSAAFPADPVIPKLRLESAALLLEKGQRDAARRLLEQMINDLATPPGLAVDAGNLLGQTFYDTGEYEKAIATWQTTIDRYPQLDGTFYSRYFIATAYDRGLGYIAQARAAYQEFLDQPPLERKLLEDVRRRVAEMAGRP